MTTMERGAHGALTESYVDAFPQEVASELERWRADRAAALLSSIDPARAIVLLNGFRPDAAGDVLQAMEGERAARLVSEMDLGRAAAVLARLEPGARRPTLDALPEAEKRELESLMAYPPDSAGAIMDANVATFKPNSTVARVQSRLRSLRGRRVQYVFVIEDDGRLVGAVPLQQLAVADPHQRLGQLIKDAGPPVSVRAMSSQTEVVEILEDQRIMALPVVDAQERLIGVIRADALLRAAEREATADVQTMVGASKEERALSPAWFAIRKRLPWLNINLLTAFLAAAVVGLFENTIAQFTALAVLLPVVAGQSGNTGAQALAVTMRGLALREVRLRHWPVIALKEVTVGAVNGVAVALVTGLGVWLWSGSMGLAGVISVSMVGSMTIASLAGASVPMVLTVLKQDPASASSIILTTVTDVMGFLSFLGLATLASGLL